MMNRKDAISRFIADACAEEVNHIMSMLSQYTNEFAEIEWYPMDEFNFMYEGLSPFEVAELVNKGDFDTGDDWFRIDYYGNLESASDSIMVDDISYWEYDVADYLIKYGDSNTDTGNDILNNIVHADETAIFNENYEIIAR